MNVVCIMGRLTRDIELRYTPQGTAVVQFSIAVNEKYKDKEQTHFFNVEAWGKTAEICNQYVKKGDRVFITGSLKQDRWEKDGQKHSRVSIRVNRITFDSRGSKEEEIELDET